MRCKKVLAVLLSAALCMPAGVASADTGDSSKRVLEMGVKQNKSATSATYIEMTPTKEEDTSEYTQITSIADLVGINNDPEGKYILMNDIDMSEVTAEGGDWDGGCGWTPLDTFNGVLDGNGHKIIGMHIYGDVDAKLSMSYVGLFSESNPVVL